MPRAQKQNQTTGAIERTLRRSLRSAASLVSLSRFLWEPLCRTCGVHSRAIEQGKSQDSGRCRTDACALCRGGQRKSATKLRKSSGECTYSAKPVRTGTNSLPMTGEAKCWASTEWIATDHNLEKLNIVRGDRQRRVFMAEVLKSFVGDKARQQARFGSFSSRVRKPHPWWTEAICASIERIDWAVSGLNEPGECWQEFTAFDDSGRVLGKHRVDGL